MSSGLTTADLSAADLLAQQPRAHIGTDSIRVGVIGYGYWGPNIVRNLSALDRCEVVSVCERNTKALKRSSFDFCNREPSKPKWISRRATSLMAILFLVH